MSAFKKYRSHKVVEAAPIIAILDYGRALLVEGGEHYRRPDGESWRGTDGKTPAIHDYLVRYTNPDGFYTSWSPKAAFEEGYTLIGESDENGGWQEVTIADLLTWMKTRPGASWKSTIADVEQAIAQMVVSNG